MTIMSDEDDNGWHLVDHFGELNTVDGNEAAPHIPTRLFSNSISSLALIDLDGDPYKYDTLDATRKEIRLLTIKAGRFEDPIRCHLSKVSLAVDARFEALSYSWGDPTPTRKIDIDGNFLGVTTNLHTALRYLRFERVPRVMWVDAVCVNQSDMAERSEQVIHMAQIYSTARDVIIWLGESSELIDKLFNVIDIVVGIGARALATARGPRGKLDQDVATLSERVSEKIQEVVWSSQDTALEELASFAKAYLRGSSLGEYLSQARAQLGTGRQYKRLERRAIREWSEVIPQHGYPTPIDLDAEMKHAVSELFGRPWWSRMWVIQEFLLAKDCTLMCGEHRLPWVEFYHFISWKSSNDNIPNLRLGITVASIGLDLHQLKNLIRSAGEERHNTSTQTKALSKRTGNIESFRMSDLMLQFEHYQASDPRDKIYALLDIAGDSGVIRPNYNATLETVYTDLVRALVTKWLNLDIICKHHRGYSNLELPSWVPDWSTTRSLPFQWSGSRGTGIDDISVIQEPYDACESTPATLEFGILQRMVARGIEHGVVTHVINIDRTDSLNWPLSHFRKLRAILLDMKLNPDTYQHTPHDTVEAYWRTLLHDIWWKTGKRMSSDELLTFPEHNLMRSHVFGNEPYTRPSDSLLEHATQITQQYSFIVSQRGYIGLAPVGTKVGDIICVLLGGQVPFILRDRVVKNIPYKVVGPAYVHGIMDGEVIRQARRKGPLRDSLQWFIID